MVQKNRRLLSSAAIAALASGSLLTATPAAAQLFKPSTATAGPVKPLGGNLRPFYGNLRPFGGNLRPFYGNLRPFWGNLRPFWGDTTAFYGDLSAFWGTSNPVVGAGGPDYAKVGDFWTKAGDDWTVAFNNLTSATPNYQTAAAKLDVIIGDSRAFWGSAVQAKTGKSFDEGFLKPFLAARGIDPANPATLGDLDQAELAYLFIEYYDGLMDFTGTDHVDHWMKTVNWSPSLSRASGTATDVRIGILDQSLVGAELGNGQVIQLNGTSSFSDGHGAAVASLLVGLHDGKGVMGLAPEAKVFAYNPFDASGTANWSDVADGVRKLKATGASVVNMSLGVPGMTFDPGWNAVFADLATTLILKSTVFVVAAGNEGVTQTKNVPWMPTNPGLIIVGSVDLDENISTFSNRPGEACLTTLGLCLPGQKLKDRFIVAPGELMLVSDGKGGTTRQIGTSFAAPLVAGAVALLHDRWPWLKNYPTETVDIILKSAKDLGAPGTDPVYGRGLLDVEASQSPLDFNSLVFFTVENGRQKLQTASGVLSTYQAEQQKTWSAQGAYVYAFEPLSLLTQRDFAIPLSQKLVGQNVTTYNGAREQFQAYLLGRMDDWAASKGVGRLAVGETITGFSSGAIALANPWNADLSVSFSPRQPRQGFRDEGPAYQSAFRFQGERSAVTFGFGDGAPALTGGATGFAQAGDYDIDRGGANPLLGLASGGGYAGWSYGLGDKVSFSAGAMVRDQARDTRLLPGLGVVGNGAERYEAAARLLSVSYKPAETLTFTGAYTRLREDHALLGIQSFDPSDFRHGSTTDGYSVSLNWAASPKLSLMATGTVGRTRASGGQSLSVGKDGLTSTAFQVGVARADLATRGDRLQVSVSQPMFVERGRLDVSTVQVIDRETGEIGVATQSLDISGKRRIAGEALYLRPVAGGLGDVALFGRVESAGGGVTGESYTTGARLRLAF